MKTTCIAFSLLTVFSASAEVPAFDSDKPVTTVTDNYVQAYIAGTDINALLTHWEFVDYVTADNFAAGYMQFVWSGTRILISNTSYSTPYSLETDIEYGPFEGSTSNRGGVVIRLDAKSDNIQDPADGDPGFNRDGIAFYPTTDGTNMIVQFTGALNGNSTPVTRILVPKPSGVSSLMNRGTMKIEDFGTSIYIYYNGSRFARINLGGLSGGKYTSGTVYDADMVSKGTFTGMEVPVVSRVAIAQRNAALRLYSTTIKMLALPAVSTFDGDKPATTLAGVYTQSYAAGTDVNTLLPHWWINDYANAANFASGYLQFVWSATRVMASTTVYTAPYSLETDIEYGSASNRGGVVIRLDNALNVEGGIQEPAQGDPGFNRHGIAFYPTTDGANMIVQFTSTENGYTTPVTRILVPKPSGVASLMNRGTMRIEDFGNSIYVYYNGTPFARINLGGLTGGKYTSGTVYDASMASKGTFTGMEVPETGGRVSIAQRDAALRLYNTEIKVKKITTSNKNIDGNRNLVVFPNPTSEVLNVSNAENARLSVYSIEGRILSTTYSKTDNAKIDVSKFKSGSYIIRITKDNMTTSTRFIIK